MAEEKEMYLIVLAGPGDIQSIIIDKETWEWLHTTPDFGDKEAIFDKTIPKGWDEETWIAPELFINSWKEDRAIHVLTSEKRFWSVANLVNYLVENNIKIIDSYEGYIS